MCRRQIMKRPVGYMDLKYLYRIVDEVKNYRCGIRFVKQGEPTLHPQLPEVIRYARDRGVLTYLSTNGFTGKEKIRRMFEARPDVVRFSFQGATPEEFEKYRVPAKYDVVSRNIKTLADLKVRAGADRPFIIIGTTLTTETEDDVELFRSAWLPFVNRIETGKTSFSWLDHVERCAGLKEHENLERRYKPCMEVVTKLSVNWNGDIGACCSDQEGVHVLGNLDRMTLAEAWRCEKEEHLRIMVGKNLEHAKLPHCRDCFIENHKFDELKAEAK